MGKQDGFFVWRDLMTTHLTQSTSFYKKLFGWKHSKMDMGPELGKYTMINAAGHDQGGYVKLDKRQGLPSHWIVYVTVPDVDRACKRVPKLGGKVCLPPTEIPGVGRFAIVEDPHGAVISPFQPSREGGEAPDYSAPGAFGWAELHSPDPAAASEFYGKLFGWKFRAESMGALGDYLMVLRGKATVGGIVQKQKQKARAAWLNYVAVESAAATAKQARALGARVTMKPTELPGVGIVAMLEDPTGAAFALFQPPARQAIPA